MDKMSLFSIMTVSVPEAFLDIYVGFVLMGQRNKLYIDDKLNVLRLLAAVVLMVSVSVISRAVLPSVILTMFPCIAFYTIILKSLYRLKWSEALLTVVLIYGVLLTIEVAYISQFAQLISNKANVLWTDDMKRLCMSIPERVLQIIIIISFWKWDLAYLNIRNNKKILFTFILLVILLFLAEFAFMFAFAYFIEKMSMVLRIVCTVASLMFAIANFLLFKIITMLSRKTGNFND